MTYNTFTSILGVTYPSKVYSALSQPKCRMNSYTFTSILGITYTYKKCYFCQRAPSIFFQNGKKNFFLLCCYVVVVATCVAKLKTIRPDSRGSKMFPQSEAPFTLHCWTNPYYIKYRIYFKNYLTTYEPYLLSNSIGMGIGI